jgi:ABC-type Zn2+ transport system substrate-binding protein/surface adhesin
MKNSLRKTAALAMAAMFAAGIAAVSFAELAEARRGGGGHHHGGHHGGHHRPHHRPHHSHHHHHHHYDNWHRHNSHYGRWVAGSIAAGVTAAAIGSMMYSLPRGCYRQPDGYYLCNGGYYAPRYYGSDLVYVRVR